GSAILQTLRIAFVRLAVLNVQHPQLPFPEVKCITEIQQFLLPSQLKIAELLPTGASLIAIKFLSMDADDETQVMLPAEHAQEHVVEFGDLHIIVNSENTGNDRAHPV